MILIVINEKDAATSTPQQRNTQASSRERWSAFLNPGSSVSGMGTKESPRYLPRRL